MKNALNTEFLKFHNYLMEGSRIYLKTFLGLAKPNQYSQSARKQISSWFWGDNFGPKSPNLYDRTTVLYDTTLISSLQFYFLNVLMYQNHSKDKSFLKSN